MEVHHHSHEGRKSFKQYFLEFFMIFLAVTMGFFAENIREFFADHAKEKQYIVSLYEDLKTDTTRMNRILDWDNKKINALSTMSNCYDTVTQNLLSTACMGTLIKNSKTNRTFQITERTLAQLSNAGGFRLFNSEDADSILSYQTLFKQYQNFESTIFQGSQDNVRNTLNGLASFKILEPMEITVSNIENGRDSASDQLTGPVLFTNDRVLLNKWFNELDQYYRVTRAQRYLIEALKLKATRIIAFYKEKHEL